MKEVERIKKICCQEMGLPYARLTTSRKKPSPKVRKLICYFLTKKLKMTRKQVGFELNINYSTVIHNLKVCFDPKIIISIEKKINNPLYKPLVLNDIKFKKSSVICVKIAKKITVKEIPIKLYGRNIEDINTEMNSIVKKMETASYDEFIEMSKRLDILFIRRKNIIDSLKKQKGFVADSLKKINQIKSIF